MKPNETVAAITTNGVVTPPTEVSAAKDEAAQIIADAKEEAEKILAKAQKKATKVAPEESADNTNDPNRIVVIKLERSSSKKDDLYVNINDHSYQIKRGVPVSVPYYVAKAIEESAAQDDHTIELIERLTSESEEWLKQA